MQLNTDEFSSNDCDITWKAFHFPAEQWNGDKCLVQLYTQWKGSLDSNPDIRSFLNGSRRQDWVALMFTLRVLQINLKGRQCYVSTERDVYYSDKSSHRDSLSAGLNVFINSLLCRKKILLKNARFVGLLYILKFRKAKHRTTYVKSCVVYDSVEAEGSTEQNKLEK